MIIIHGKRNCIETDKAKLIVKFHNIEHQYIEDGSPLTIYKGQDKLNGLEDLIKEVNIIKGNK